MTDYKYLLFEQQGPVVRITLNRPDAANGLNAALVAELEQAARHCDREPEIKVVVLQGAAGRFFCAGGDIREMLSHGDAVESGLKALADRLHEAISILMRMNAALIVSVNGIAAGAGFSLALIGDLVLAAESASFTMAYTRSGLCPDGSSTWLLPRLVGLRKAQELMLLNPVLTAAEACDLGLVTRVVADSELGAESERLAAEMASGARLSTAAVRKLLMASAGNHLEEQMELEGQLISRCAASPDGREGLDAFVAKRKPEFR